MDEKHNIPKRESGLKRLAKSILFAIGIGAGAGCVTGGSFGAGVGFGARAIPCEDSSMDYDNATSLGLRGSVRTKHGIEAEVGYGSFTTSGEVGVVNHDVSATELSGSVSYNFISNDNVEAYAGVGATSTTQNVNETYDILPDTTEISQSETDFRVFAGGRLQAGPGQVDVRVASGKRGSILSAAYRFIFGK